MFKIKPRNRYGYKDLQKSLIADAYIGYGAKGTCTDKYMHDAIEQSVPCNDDIEPSADTVAFVSVNGNSVMYYGAEATINREKTFENVESVLDAGGKVVTDNPQHRERDYNTGERWLAKELLKLGCKESIYEHYSIWSKHNE